MKNGLLEFSKKEVFSLYLRLIRPFCIFFVIDIKYINQTVFAENNRPENE